KLLTHPTILREIWGRPYREESNYLHVYISHLRRKIEPDPARPRYLLNQPGVGYRLLNPEAPPQPPPRAPAPRARGSVESAAPTSRIRGLMLLTEDPLSPGARPAAHPADASAHGARSEGRDSRAAAR